MSPGLEFFYYFEFFRYQAVVTTFPPASTLILTRRYNWKSKPGEN